MSALFIDCPADMVALWEGTRRAGDPAVTVNVEAGQPADIPQKLRGHRTLVVDHTYLDAATLGQCEGLRHIVFLGTGASSFIDVAAAVSRGILVHTIKGYGDVTVAEHTIALALAAAREVARMDREVRAGSWRQISGMQIRDKVLGVLGLGGIGREVARLGEGLGMRVLAWNRSPVERATVPVEEVLAGADILCVCLALNDGTAGFLSAERLRQTKAGVILVNTARAAIVDQAALAELLRTGHIRHAALDVFTREPIDSDDPLLTLPNVTLTPHAGFMTPEATLTMLRRAMELVIQHDG